MLLKKQNVVPGVILEILPDISTGLPPMGPGPHDLVGGFLRREHFPVYIDFFMDHWKLPSGTKMEVLCAPKRMREAGTRVKVKVLGSEQEIVGTAFWCEVRASCKIVSSPAAGTYTSGEQQHPKKPRSKKVKEFTPKQLARLPDMGYWVEEHGNSKSFYCLMNGRIKYIHGGHRDGEWSTLLWSCCPTRKQIANPQHGEKYHHFKTHAEMLEKFPDIRPAARIKAPNDV
ncbi:MAG TPA: hypothetical protein V6D22_25180 [Candidatus Obscuribacterales bacterium]